MDTAVSHGVTLQEPDELLPRAAQRLTFQGCNGIQFPHILPETAIVAL